MPGPYPSSTCRRYVGDPEAIALALQQVWPLLEKGFMQHKGNVRAIERYARCPRYALRSAGLSLASLDGPLTYL